MYWRVMDGIIDPGVLLNIDEVQVSSLCRTNKQVTGNHYQVRYRRGTAGIMDLEGLSENQTSESAQNRQNDYQRRIGQPLGADGGASKDTTPLLQVLDDVTVATLLEKGLLIDSDRLVLGEMVGQ
ncbi:hypothetical protein MAR_010949, partial [Mya arenaria]